jgi:hypothetical protein
MVVCQTCLLGTCKWLRHSGHEAKRLWLETAQLKGLITTVLMDGNADDQALFFERQRHIRLLTTTSKGQDQSPKRKRLIKVLQQQKNKRLYKQRS